MIKIVFFFLLLQNNIMSRMLYQNVMPLLENTLLIGVNLLCGE